jgi:hypothetical protein
MENPQNTSQELNNSKLAHEYTEKIWDTVISSRNNVTTKLTTFLGFSGLLLRFASDLNNYGTCLNLKILVCFTLSLSIVVCCIGLMPGGSGETHVPPEDFLETTKWYRAPEEEARLYIARGLNKATKTMVKSRAFRSRCLQAVIIFGQFKSEVHQCLID